MIKIFGGIVDIWGLDIASSHRMVGILEELIEQIKLGA
jgi:hypothetical protein